jgi:hypothetical protein
MRRTKKRSEKVGREISQFDGSGGTQTFIVNQIASATITTTIAPHTTGVTFLELPLRGESFGA